MIHEELSSLARIYDRAFQDKIKEFQVSCDEYLPYVRALVQKWEDMRELQSTINCLEVKYGKNIKDLIGEEE